MSTAGRVLGAVTVLALMAATRAAASSCAADCVRQMADCRAERCAGLNAKACRDRCRAVTGCRAGGARLRTLATVVNECQVQGGIWTGSARLEIKHGDCPAETVMQVTSGSVPDSNPSLCELLGQYRDGSTAVVTHPLQRLGVSPDGRTVLFEVNTHVAWAPFAGPPFEVPEEGIFAVGPHGRVRRVTDASRERSYRVSRSDNFDGVPYITTFSFFSFSPNGRFAAFSDRGPGSDGSDGAQIVVVDLESGDRTQVTHFRAVAPGVGSDATAFFVDDDTLGLFGYGEEGYGSFTVRRDGTRLRPIVASSPGSIGGTLESSFRVAGPFGTTVTLPLENKPPATQPVPGTVRELFGFALPDRLLQLTQIGRSDTQAGPSRTGRDLVFFLSSGEPVPGQNPQHICQLFSIDTLGTRLRQLTHFESAVPGRVGCYGGDPPPDCRVALTSQPEFDPKTGTLVFDATCDPFGLHPVGLQVFAMRANGSGLRQLTNYRGTEGTAADGTLRVELPGPIEIPGVKN